MRKTIAGLLALGATMLVTSSALAQGLGAEGSMALSAERLFGFTSYKTTVEPDVPGSVEAEHSGSQFTLMFGQPAETGHDFMIPVPGTIPRVAFDYFVIDSLSLGGSLGYYSASGEYDPGGGGVTVDDADVTGFALVPRVGYLFPIGDTAGFWLRGGFTYFHASVDYGATEVSGSIFQLNIEGMFAIPLTEGFAIVVGPAIDVPLSGKFEYDAPAGSTDVDVKTFSFGGYAGLMGYF